MISVERGVSVDLLRQKGLERIQTFPERTKPFQPTENFRVKTNLQHHVWHYEQLRDNDAKHNQSSNSMFQRNSTSCSQTAGDWQIISTNHRTQYWVCQSLSQSHWPLLLSEIWEQSLNEWMWMRRCVCVCVHIHTVLQCIPIGGESEPELGTEDYWELLNTLTDWLIIRLLNWLRPYVCLLSDIFSQNCFTVIVRVESRVSQVNCFHYFRSECWSFKWHVLLMPCFSNWDTQDREENVEFEWIWFILERRTNKLSWWRLSCLWTESLWKVSTYLVLFSQAC